MSLSEYTLDLSATVPHGTDFFGYWISALDRGNQVSFYSIGRLLFTFTPTDVLAAVNASPDRAQYYGNPNAAFGGQNSGEPYIFLSFFSNDRSFDNIVFDETPRYGGYESDNHTVGRFTGQGTGTIVPLVDSTFEASVPEPATWAMMVAGFGLVGAGMRHRATNVVVA